MIEFNLEKALAGDKVITRDGGEVTQLVVFETEHGPMLYGYEVNSDMVESWEIDGSYFDVPRESGDDLFMDPCQLSGFVNVYPNGGMSRSYLTKDAADSEGFKRIACIDLSTHREGEGL